MNKSPKPADRLEITVLENGRAKQLYYSREDVMLVMAFRAGGFGRWPPGSVPTRPPDTPFSFQLHGPNETPLSP